MQEDIKRIVAQHIHNYFKKNHIRSTKDNDWFTAVHFLNAYGTEFFMAVQEQSGRELVEAWLKHRFKKEE